MTGYHGNNKGVGKDQEWYFPGGGVATLMPDGQYARRVGIDEPIFQAINHTPVKILQSIFRHWS